MKEFGTNTAQISRTEILKRIGEELNTGPVQPLAEDFPQYGRALDDLPLIGPPRSEVLRRKAKTQIAKWIGEVWRSYFSWPPHD